MDQHFIYAAYGSTMHPKQMPMLCNSAEFLGFTTLEGYTLLFRGNAGYATATIEMEAGSRVPLALWQIRREESLHLDKLHRYPERSECVKIPVLLENKTVEAFTYVQNTSQPLNMPCDNYLDKILDVYEAEGFDPLPLEAALEKSLEEISGRN